MKDVRSASAALAAFLALAVGVLGAAESLSDPAKEPAWSQAMKPLADAPIAAGSRVGLSLPASVSIEQAQPVLFEAAWQRPDLLWGLATAWPPDLGPPSRLVLLGSAPCPDGWKRVWGSGLVAVYAPLAP